MTRVAIVGLGLIGGSIAAGLKQRNPAHEISAWDKDRSSLEAGLELGLIDIALSDLADIDADIVVLAVPVLALEALVPQIDFVNSIVTDVGSVKGHVLETLQRTHGEVPSKFVPGHPIAGSEQHGVAAADPDLFENHRVILTPLGNTNEDAVNQVADLWQGLGGTITKMSPEHHDQILAQTSHLPHLLAYALVDTLSLGGDSLEVFQYAAGGFRDFSRIAASDPVMWRDVFLTNSEPVLEVLDRYVDDVAKLRELIASGDGAALEEIFGRAKTARDHFAEINRHDD